MTRVKSLEAVNNTAFYKTKQITDQISNDHFIQPSIKKIFEQINKALEYPAVEEETITDLEVGTPIKYKKVDLKTDPIKVGQYYSFIFNNDHYIAKVKNFNEQDMDLNYAIEGEYDQIVKLGHISNLQLVTLVANPIGLFSANSHTRTVCEKKAN